MLNFLHSYVKEHGIRWKTNGDYGKAEKDVRHKSYHRSL